jgi:hypothetical protein
MIAIRRKVRKTLFNVRRLMGVEAQAVLLGQIRAEQILAKPTISSLAEAEFRVFSQWGEDGILSWLVDVIGPGEHSFVEFGVEDYHESNTRYLLHARGWRGLVIDGSAANIADIQADQIAYKHDFVALASFITRENIAVLLNANGFGERIGILSVDIDGVDYWVLEAIEARCDIIVVEYNDFFGAAPVSVPYDPAFARLDQHWSGMYWGASLGAFRHLLEGRGYVFAGTNRAGTNAFFVDSLHADKLADRLQQKVSWPCRMREVRRQDGGLALKTYAEAGQHIAHLPLVNVATGESVRVADALVQASP